MKRRNFIKEFLIFLLNRKEYWIVPVIFFLILLALLIWIGSSPVTGFVYTIF